MYLGRIPASDLGSVDWSVYPASLGVTHELCAGIVDKPQLSLAEIMREEITEECGYDVPLEKIERVTSCRLKNTDTPPRARKAPIRLFLSPTKHENQGQR